MTETKHTPGPWRKVWEKQEDGTYPIETVGEWTPIAWVKGEANAHLIAAAPDLQELCDDTKECLGGFLSAFKEDLEDMFEDDVLEILHDLRNRAEKLSSKAKGENQ